jgi:hypothetical protein
MPVSQKRLTDALGYSGVLTPGHFRPTAAPVSQKRLTDEEERRAACLEAHSHPCGTTYFEKDSFARTATSRGSLAS